MLGINFLRNTLLISVIGLVVFGCQTPPPPNAQIPADMLPALVNLPAGTFIMGDQANSGDADEKPAHNVDVAAFSMGVTEVTWEQYQFFVSATGRNLPSDQGWGREKRPVINVSWEDANEYTKWLSAQTGDEYRLPTEAEWEYAARAQALSLYANGNAAEKLCDVANIADLSVTRAGLLWSEVTRCDDGVANQTASVASYSPNAYALYDMHGNVWEWVQDCYKASYQSMSAQRNTAELCAKRVIRGGSFQQPAQSARLSNRESMPQNEKSYQVGFRVVKQ